MTINPNKSGKMRMNMLKPVLLLFAMTAVSTVSAQQITLKSKSQTKRQTVGDIQTQTNYKVFFEEHSFNPAAIVDLDTTVLPLAEIFDKLIEGTELAYTIDGSSIVLHRDVSRQQTMAVRTLSGTVRSADGEALSGARVEILDMPDKRTATDRNGRFRIADVAAGNRIVRVTPVAGSEVRYREVTVSAEQDTDVTLTLDRLAEPASQEQPASTTPATPATTYFVPREEAAGATPTGPGTDMFLVSGSQIVKNYLPKAAIKTNLLIWGTTTPNVALEFGLAPKWTLDVSVAYNPFQLERGGVNHVTIVSPEVRYWFCQRFEKHFIGLHGLAGTYNIGDVTFLTKTFETVRYDGWGVGAGLSYGYHLPMGKRWAWEFTVGVGYIHLQYDKYRCESCDDYLGKEQMHYFGPTKAGISLIFMVK